jgi:APA family basic amino acid/polyamine antiporter
MDLAIIAAFTTVALTGLLSQIRIFYAMANDGLLPPVFATVRSRAPWISPIISGISCLSLSIGLNSCKILGLFCAVISGIFPVDIVGETTSIAALITYLFVHIDVIIVS